MLRFLVVRPIGVLMTSLSLMICAALVIRQLPVSLLPTAPVPEIIVQIGYPNTSARELERSVVRHLRNGLMQIGHLKDIESVARDHNAIIKLELNIGTDVDLAYLEVNEKIDQLMSSMPRELERPRVLKSSTSDIPVYYLSVSPRDSSRQLDLELSEVSRSILKRRIEQLEDIAFVDRTGYAEPMILIVPNQQLLKSLNISESSVQQALIDNNVSLGQVILKEGQYQYQVDFMSELRTPEDIEKIFLRTDGRVIQLRDLVDITLVEQSPRGLHLLNGQRAILFSIRKTSDAQLLTLQKKFNSLVERLREEYPQLVFTVTNDQSSLLQVSISSLRTSLLYGGMFAVLIVLVFYRSAYFPLLIGLSVPIALLVAVLGFAIMDLSINIISLSGLILGLGLMIDNSIIVSENILYYRSIPLTPTESSVKGANEIIRPLLSSSLTTCSVFIPLVTLSGVAGVLFYDQAVSIVLALGSSIVIAYFLLPTVLALTPYKRKSITRIKPNLFGNSVERVLAFPWLVMAAYTILILLGFQLAKALPRSAFPNITKNAITLRLDWNEPLRLIESYNRTIDVINSISEHAALSNAFIGEKQFLLQEENQSLQELTLDIYLNKSTNLKSALDDLKGFLSRRYPSAVVDIAPRESIFDRLFSNNSPPLVAWVQDSRSDRTPTIADITELIESMRENDIPVQEIATQTGFTITLDQVRILQYNISRHDLLSKLKSLFNQHEISQLNGSDQRLPIVWGVQQRDMQTLIDEAEILNKSGAHLPLSLFITLERTEEIASIEAGKAGEHIRFQFDSYSQKTISKIERVIQKTKRYTVSFGGQYFDNQLRLKELLLAGAAAFCLLFLILTAQFESLSQPLIVLLVVPFGLCGSIIFLFAFGGSINIMSVIGMVVTSGIVVNDAILKVDMINRARKTHAIKESIHIGGARRLKPIVMTSMTTILALTPVIFASGLGAELQKPLAAAIIGGLLFGTVGSLYLVPVLYLSISPEKESPALS